MLLGIHDNSVLAKFEQHENENPCPRKELDDRTIYLSRPMLLTKGEPCITDLSEARFGDYKHTDRIMPNVYRAPEVILGFPWTYPVDIWGFGMVVSILVQNIMTLVTTCDSMLSGRVEANEGHVYNSSGICSSRNASSRPQIRKVDTPRPITLQI